MKKTLLPLSFALMATAVNAQLGVLTNGGFENWTNANIYSTPANWVSSNMNEWYGTPLCSKSTDAQHLTYSVLLENEVLNGDSLFGYVYMGNPSGASLDGIPYTSDFDAVTGFYKCNTVGTDTAFVIVNKSFMGVDYPPVFGAIYGNVSSWTAFTFPVPSGPCDSVFIAFTSSNPFDYSNFNAGTWAMFDNVSFTNTGPAPAALPNPSFETWTDVMVNDPDNWDSYNTILASAGIINVSQTTDAAVGTYAALLETQTIPMWGNDTIPGILTNGTIDPTGNLWTTPYTAEPANFSGQYKYAPAGSDMAEVIIEFYQMGSAIGSFYLPITSAAASYTSMGGPLTLTGTPDSMVVIMSSGYNPGSILKVDDLNLTGGNVGLQEMARKLGFKVYPNPTHGVFSLEWDAYSYQPVHFTLTDITGKTIMVKELVSASGTNTKEINIEDLPAGVYTYMLRNNEINKYGKLIKE